MENCTKLARMSEDIRAMNNTNSEKITYPNGSIETYSLKPTRSWIYLEAPNPIDGRIWGMPIRNRIFGAGGNPDADGIHRRGRKWHPHFEDGIGWEWR